MMQHLSENQAEAREMKQDIWRNICECTQVSSESFNTSLLKNRVDQGSINAADLDEGETGA